MDYINKNKTEFTDRIENDFDNLKIEVAENPELLKQFNDDDLIEFYKKSNVYTRKCIDSEKYNKQFTLMSYVNTREEYFKKMITTTMISYLFRNCLDYQINLTDLKAVVKDDDFLEPEPNKYVENEKYERKQLKKLVKQEYIKNNYELELDLDDTAFIEFELSDEDKDKIENETKNKLQELQKITYKVNKDKKLEKIKELAELQSKEEQHVIYRFLKNIFTFNPDRHIKQSYKYEEVADNYEEYKKLVLTKVEDDVKKELNIGSTIAENNIPSDNLWYKFNMYYEAHYELFKTFTNLLYKVDSDRDLMLNIHGQFDTKAEVDSFVKLNQSNFITNPTLIKNNNWVLLAKYLPNRENGEVLGQDSDILNGLLEKYKEDSKLAQDFTKQNMKRSKLEQMYRHGNTSNINDYLNSGLIDNKPSDNVVSEDEYKEFENKINKLSVPKSDDDYAIQYKIFKPTESGLDETTIYQ